MNTVTLALWCVVLGVTMLQAGAQEQDPYVPSHLLDSVVRRDVSGIRPALEGGENIDLTNDRGWSAARFAVAMGDLDVLHELILRGIDLNNADNEGYTPLMAAASIGDKEMVEALIAGNASPLQKTHDGRDAYNAGIEGGRQLVALLVAEAAAVHAIQSENVDDLFTALERGAYINIRNGAGWTPAMFIVARGDIELVKKVLKHGPDLNRTENDGWTVLHFAAAQGSAPIAQLLLNENVNPHIRNLEGKTARQVALERNHREVAELLPEDQEESASST